MKLLNLDIRKQLDESVETMKHNRKEKVIADYRKYANLKENESINEIDEWALTEACFQNNYRKDILRNDLEQFRSK